jgi:hypothetical protein
MLSFLNLVALRAKNCDWDVFNIPISAAGVTPAITKTFITEYGEIPLDKVQKSLQSHKIERLNTTISYSHA